MKSRNMKQFRSQIGSKKQKGMSVLNILIATILGAAAVIATISAVMGQKTDADQATVVGFVTSEVLPVLTSQYLNGGNSFTPFSGACGTKGTIAAAGPATAGTCAQNLTNAKGLRTELPAGQSWSVASATATNVVVNVGCADATRCSLLKAAIDAATSKINPAATRPTTAATAAAPFQVVVTYPSPV